MALAGRVDEGRAFVGQHLERAPGAWARLFSETGMTRDITDKFDEGARLLERLE